MTAVLAVEVASSGVVTGGDTGASLRAFFFDGVPAISSSGDRFTAAIVQEVVGGKSDGNFLDFEVEILA